MADENQPLQDAPPAETPPAPPQEDWQAKAAAAEARAAAAEAARVEAERAAQERLAQVAYAVSQMNEAQRAPEVPEDDGEVVTLGKVKNILREFGSEFARAAQNTVTEETSGSYRHMRALNRREAQTDPSLKYFSKYKDEIEAMVDKLPPKTAANPDVYKGVYQFVVAKHLDEVAEAEANERLNRRLAETDEYGEPMQPSAPVRAEPPMPRGDGGRSAISAPGRRGGVRLDDWDRFAAARYYGGDTGKLLQAKERAAKPADLDDLLGLNNKR